jgi:hypothetical protein
MTLLLSRHRLASIKVLISNTHVIKGDCIVDLMGYMQQNESALYGILPKTPSSIKHHTDLGRNDQAPDQHGNNHRNSIPLDELLL